MKPANVQMPERLPDKFSSLILLMTDTHSQAGKTRRYKPSVGFAVVAIRPIYIYIYINISLYQNIAL